MWGACSAKRDCSLSGEAARGLFAFVRMTASVLASAKALMTPTMSLSLAMPRTTSKRWKENGCPGFVRRSDGEMLSSGVLMFKRVAIAERREFARTHGLGGCVIFGWTNADETRIALATNISNGEQGFGGLR